MKRAAATTAKVLAREVFKTSRELEYFTRKELTLQTGHEPERWSEVAFKELIDNGLDACESANTLPSIKITVADDSLTITDNGPGIPESVIESVLDFSVRASSKDAYISPTRGAQGNALKTVLAIPYVLNDQNSARLEITTQGALHRITVEIDRLAQKPAISHQKAEAIVKNGTSVKVYWPSELALNNDLAIWRFLQLLEGYSLFNPHAEFSLDDERLFQRSSDTCEKWLASEPTSPHWYTLEQLRALIAAYIVSEQHGAQARTVREFVTEFRGLSATAKQKKILASVGMAGVYLRDLVKDGDIDRSAVEKLLAAMRAESKPVKPAHLGFIGEDHFRAWFESQGVELQTMEYRRVADIDSKTGRPFVVEIAFAARRDNEDRRLITGINWSPTLVDPFRSFSAYGFGLASLLSSLKVEPDDAVTFVLHLACPHLNYTDRGKSSLEGL
ncbi:MAG TPA: ATP-binding protein [Pyrinomonadaceae bacterium]